MRKTVREWTGWKRIRESRGDDRIGEMMKGENKRIGERKAGK